MRVDSLTSFFCIAATFVVVASLAGCGSKLDGTYTPADGAGLISSITFKSGGKCELTGLGMTKEGTFVVEDNKVKITVSNDTTIMTIDDHGCLDGGGIIGKFCKGTAKGASAKSSNAG